MNVAMTRPVVPGGIVTVVDAPVMLAKSPPVMPPPSVPGVTTWRRRCAGSGLLLSVGVAACGGDEGGGVSGDSETLAPPEASDESAPAEEPPAPDGAAMTAMLSLVPDVPGAGDLVIVSDYAAAADAVGVDPPGPGADQDAIVEWHEALTIGREGEQGAGVQITAFLNNELTDDAGWRAEIGWAPLDVTRSVETTGDEFGPFYALTGAFDPDTGASRPSSMRGPR